MKELIEKIKKIKYMDYYDCESALDRALELIQEEENKPFNPTDFGFRIYGIGDYQVTFIKEIKPCVYIWLNQYGTENHYYSISKTPSNIAPCMIDNAKIKTNFEARIILKSLGVID